MEEKVIVRNDLSEKEIKEMLVTLAFTCAANDESGCNISMEFGGKMLIANFNVDLEDIEDE